MAAALLSFDPDTAQRVAALTRLHRCTSSGPAALLKTSRKAMVGSIDLRFGLRFRHGFITMPAGVLGT